MDPASTTGKASGFSPTSWRLISEFFDLCTKSYDQHALPYDKTISLKKKPLHFSLK